MTNTHLARGLAASLLIVALSACAPAEAAPAPAPAPASPADNAFLNLTGGSGPDEAARIASAHRICDQLEGGVSISEVLRGVLDDAAHPSQLVYAAYQSYCPSVPVDVESLR